MRRVLFFSLTLAASLTFFNMTDCGWQPDSNSKTYAYIIYNSFTSEGTDLHVILKEARLYNDVPECSFYSDGKPDTATFTCIRPDSTKYDTTLVFTDSTTVVLNGHNIICTRLYRNVSGEIETRPLLTQDVLEVGSVDVEKGTDDTVSFSGGFFYPTEEIWCSEYDTDMYLFTFVLHLRSDSPYVWIRPVGYDSVFVSPETTAYLIEEPFPFTATDSFRLAHRRVIKLHRGKFYHYGSVELVSDSEGWATLRVSFSVVPKLGWTLPPVDTTI